ncbi:ABC transporter permease [Dysgonomonas sp. 25]|uniref:ABC transporter permease n=1 Tax=Dysgonomonas sp. 25 TaxID=2302933 RepID=UPI001C86A279|nr:ABC transporter permease [Dysgonomonas sp. 25]
MFDSLREIYATVSKNVLRTVLTMLAVAWGILMLILLMGVGNGFSNSAKKNFSDRSANKVYMWPRWTSMPHNGLASNRKITFRETDAHFLMSSFPEIQLLTPIIYRSETMSYGNEYGSWQMQGVWADAKDINAVKIKKGRFVNDIDIANRRKVIVINPDMEKILFKGGDPIGKDIIAGNVVYTVIGVSDNANQFNNEQPTYIPYSTAQTLYGSGINVDEFVFTVEGLNTEEANDEFVDRLRSKMGGLKSFNPTDRSAIGVWNTAAQSMQANNIFTIISIFIKIIGAASLITGIVGVGNIMLITVKERTQEIGIRKAIGARPRSILSMIITEAVIITSIAGYIGLSLGIFILEIVNYAMTAMGGEGGPPSNSPIQDMSVDLWTVLGATVILIVSGIVAGMIPAVKAARVSPIESMRAE